jgi:hypothetical protein
MLHLYALAAHPARIPSIGGIGDTKLAVVEIDASIDAIVSEVQAEPSEAAMLAHARVVEDLAAVNDAVLPARFRSGYENEEVLGEAIRGRSAELGRALGRVRGCVEIGLRVLHGRSLHDDRANTSGRDYMVGRLDAVRRAERIAGELHESLAAAARESTSQVLATQQLVLSAAYLLPRPELESFRAAVEEAERARPGLTFVCTGPWPPYSFAVLGDEPR